MKDNIPFPGCKRETLRLNFRSADKSDVELVLDVVKPTRARQKLVAVYMPGYTSVRRGEKALAFAQAFASNGFTFITFDPRGHGESSGVIAELTLDRHLEDLRHVIALARTLGSTIIGIGSSLGGLTIAAHAAHFHRDFKSIITIAPGFGFFERWSTVPKKKWPSGMTQNAIDSARLATTALIAPKVKNPMLIWHGMRDDAVDWQQSARFAELCPSFVELRLMNQGEHRLTAWKDRLALESVDWARLQL